LPAQRDRLEIEALPSRRFAPEPFGSVCPSDLTGPRLPNGGSGNIPDHLVVRLPARPMILLRYLQFLSILVSGAASGFGNVDGVGDPVAMDQDIPRRLDLRHCRDLVGGRTAEVG